MSAAPDTSTVVKVVRGPIVRSSGARYRITEHRHEGPPQGLRTVEIHWITAADRANGGWPAGTVVTRVIRGHLGKPSGVLYSETVHLPTEE